MASSEAASGSVPSSVRTGGTYTPAWKNLVFLGWFGPRGLASVVFALLALEELSETSEIVLEAVSVVALTVLLSVILHGVTAEPAARSYGGREAAQDVTTGPRATPRGFLHHTRRP